MKDLLKKFIPPKLKWLILRALRNDIQETSVIAHGQEGEDLALLRQMEYKRTGFYVDVGAHHPSRFSNTLAFSNLGWRGINIEANPDAAEIFRKKRPKDINLNVGIANRRDEMKFMRFDEPALNTFSEEIARERENAGFRVRDSVQIQVYTLKEILDAHLPDDIAIDFFTIDVEGLDLEVLSSNDWQKYRPRYVVVEILECGLDELGDHPITQFLVGEKYAPVIKTGHSVIFERVA